MKTKVATVAVVILLCVYSVCSLDEASVQDATNRPPRPPPPADPVVIEQHLRAEQQGTSEEAEVTGSAEGEKDVAGSAGEKTGAPAGSDAVTQEQAAEPSASTDVAATGGDASSGEEAPLPSLPHAQRFEHAQPPTPPPPAKLRDADGTPIGELEQVPTPPPPPKVPDVPAPPKLDRGRAYRRHPIELTDEQHKALHKGHSHIVEDGQGGHTHMVVDPFLLILSLFVIMLGAQAVLFRWKKNYYRSYQNTTLFFLWIVPLLLSFYVFYWRFLVIWAVYSFFSGRVMWKATRKTISRDTPRVVYRWFHLVYKACNFTAILGYGIMLASMFVDTKSVFGLQVTEAAILLMFYGLYLGVLGRDCAEMCADRMSSSLGYKSDKDSLPMRNLGKNICAICDHALLQSVRATSDKKEAEETIYTLDCKHQFHEFCLRGWLIVGKKDTCPYCSEKVRLSGVFSNPWEKPSITWAQILDGVRYLIVWNPIILMVAQVVLHFLPHTHPMAHYSVSKMALGTGAGMAPQLT